jgi:hypothetical protein
MQYLTRVRHPADRNEVDPLDVPDDGEAVHGDAA